jgi:hypothetical protein
MSLRLSERERERVGLAASYFRVKPSEYIRQAITDRLDADAKRRVIETELREMMQRTPEAWRAMSAEDVRGALNRILHRVEEAHPGVLPGSTT